MVFNLFKKKKNKSQHSTLTIKSIIRETSDTITIEFEQPEEGDLKYKAGQYLTCICEVAGKEERRCYSLNTSPYLQEAPAITIKKDPEGRVSNYLFEKAKPGDKIKVLMPEGNFTTEFSSSNRRHFVMVAGGSGITPLMSIIISALEKEPQSFVTLIYGNRNQSSIIFKERLEKLSREKGGRLKVVHVLSQPEPDWQGLKGRITVETFKQVLNDAPAYDSTDYFICGPGGMMTMVENYLSSIGVNQKNIHKERFVIEEKKKSSGSAEPSEVTLLMDNEEYRFTVKPGRTILESALDNDIDMPYSCQSGICSTCRCLKLDGEVKMDEDEGLSDQEIADGYVLVCVGHPLTPKVKLKHE